MIDLLFSKLLVKHSLIINSTYIWKENKAETILQSSIDELMRKSDWMDFVVLEKVPQQAVKNDFGD